MVLFLTRLQLTHEGDKYNEQDNDGEHLLNYVETLPCPSCGLLPCAGEIPLCECNFHSLLLLGGQGLICYHRCDTQISHIIILYMEKY